MRFNRSPDAAPLDPASLPDRFRAFISDSAFPCLGAKSALARGRLRIFLAQAIGVAHDDPLICAALIEFAEQYRRDPRPFSSLAVIFAAPDYLTEVAFEAALWTRLQCLSDRDGGLGQVYDPRVSSDAASPHFSLSFGGEAFFVVGLHPGASRAARRFETSVMVFNPHDQFEKLRAQGRYEGLRRRIMARDLAIAGSSNPMLAQFGDASAARQYSGRDVGDQWKCPFIAKLGTDYDAL